MEKDNFNLFVGLVWLICGIYQFKNDNTFMVIMSAVISVIFFALGIYSKIKNKDSNSGGKKNG